MKYEEEINEGGIECNDAFQSKEPLIIEDINDIFSLGVEGLKWLGDMEIKVSFQKFCLDRICLICKMEDPLIWSSIH